MTIYFLSGLGADSRVFKYLSFPVNTKTVFIDWLVPNERESLREYAKRIAEKIDASKPFILVGLSFGGMLATEVMEFVKPRKTILLSSIAQRKELPFYYKLAGYFRFNKLIPAKAFNKSNSLIYWFLSVNGAKDKLLVNDILTDTNTRFSRWAINEILNWQRKELPSNIIRIHGDKDRVLPVTCFKPDYVIKNGGHFMVVNRTNEISEILETILKNEDM